MSVLVITTNYGVEQDELVRPVEALRAAGIDVVIAATEAGAVQTLVSDKDPGEEVQADTSLDAVSVDDHDVLVVPGGTINADNLRTQDAAVELARGFADAGKTIASICHGPWLLAEAGLVEGKTLTSFPSVSTDLRNAGGTWVDEELVTNDANGWTLITSRSPRDLDAFNSALVAAAR